MCPSCGMVGILLLILGLFGKMTSEGKRLLCGGALHALRYFND